MRAVGAGHFPSLKLAPVRAGAHVGAAVGGDLPPLYDKSTPRSTSPLASPGEASLLVGRNKADRAHRQRPAFSGFTLAARGAASAAIGTARERLSHCLECGG